MTDPISYLEDEEESADWEIFEGLARPSKLSLRDLTDSSEYTKHHVDFRAETKNMLKLSR
jgi:hypothetical protein